MLQRAISVALLLLLTTQARADSHIVMLIGEDEYHTAETLPEFAKTEFEPRGIHVTIVEADAKDKNNFPGLMDALSKADLLLVSTRRRTMPKEQIDAVKAYLAAGKPLVGIRTACHAFAPPISSKKNPAPTSQPGAGWAD